MCLKLTFEKKPIVFWTNETKEWTSREVPFQLFEGLIIRTQYGNMNIGIYEWNDNVDLNDYHLKNVMSFF